MLPNDSRYTKLGPDSDSVRQARRDWLKERFQQEPVKVMARKTGLSEVAVINIRTGRNAISYDALRDLCLNDEEFREALIADLRSDPWTAAGAVRPQSYAPPVYGDPNVDGALPGSVEETEALMQKFGRRE